MFEIEYRTNPCPWCGSRSIVKLDEQNYRRWIEGELAQVAFPDMDNATRELLITGTHPACWNEMMSVDPEEEYIETTT